MGFDEGFDAVRRGKEVLVDGPHHGQRRAVKRYHREFPGLVERHVDALTGDPATTYDSTQHSAGTSTWVYLPPAPPSSSGGAVVARP
jgi:hypothetical protein